MYAIAAYHEISGVYNVWYFWTKDDAVSFLESRQAIKTDWHFMKLLQEVQM